jgi:hypothetical protein
VSLYAGLEAVRVLKGQSTDAQCAPTRTFGSSVSTNTLTPRILFTDATLKGTWLIKSAPSSLSCPPSPGKKTELSRQSAFGPRTDNFRVVLVSPLPTLQVEELDCLRQPGDIPRTTHERFIRAQALLASLQPEVFQGCAGRRSADFATGTMSLFSSIARDSSKGQPFLCANVLPPTNRLMIQAAKT